jgi:hypothetical protein
VLSILQYNRFKLIALAVAIVACWWQRKRMKPASGFILLLLVAEFALEVLAIQQAYSSGSNMWVYNIDLPVEFALLSICAWMYWPHRVYRCWLLIGGLVFAAVYAWEAPKMFPENGFVQWSYLLGSLLIIGAFSALLFRMALSNDQPPVRDPIFWFGFSTVFFFGGMIPLMGLFTIMNERDQALLDKLYTINDVLFHLRFALVALPLFLLPKKRTVSDL